VQLIRKKSAAANVHIRPLDECLRRLICDVIALRQNAERSAGLTAAVEREASAWRPAVAVLSARRSPQMHDGEVSALTFSAAPLFAATAG
jgi:hypothetical protein